MAIDLTRFIEAQEQTYSEGLAEISAGHKTGHWLWYIFPQKARLGLSEASKFYAIKTMEDAKAYFNISY